MRYAEIKYNDIVDGEGVCVSLWVQGCPHRCKGCHNPEQWDFEGGQPLPNDIKSQLIQAISKNNVKRNFSLLGGEPLCEENYNDVFMITKSIRSAYPDIKIFCWTGYTLEELRQKYENINEFLDLIDVLIDGRYEEGLRDITLYLRGSSNQRVLKKGIDF